MLFLYWSGLIRLLPPLEGEEGRFKHRMLQVGFEFLNAFLLLGLLYFLVGLAYLFPESESLVGLGVEHHLDHLLQDFYLCTALIAKGFLPFQEFASETEFPLFKHC
jgi:hypothetical protein